MVSEGQIQIVHSILDRRYNAFYPEHISMMAMPLVSDAYHHCRCVIIIALRPSWLWILYVLPKIVYPFSSFESSTLTKGRAKVPPSCSGLGLELWSYCFYTSLDSPVRVHDYG